MITGLLARLRAGEISRHEYFAQLELVQEQPKSSQAHQSRQLNLSPQARPEVERYELGAKPWSGQVPQARPEVGRYGHLAQESLWADQISQARPEIERYRNLLQESPWAGQISQPRPEVERYRNLAQESPWAGQISQARPDVERYRNLAQESPWAGQISQARPDVERYDHLEQESPWAAQISQARPDVERYEHLEQESPWSGQVPMQKPYRPRPPDRAFSDRRRSGSYQTPDRPVPPESADRNLASETSGPEPSPVQDRAARPQRNTAGYPNPNTQFRPPDRGTDQRRNWESSDRWYSSRERGMLDERDGSSSRPNGSLSPSAGRTPQSVGRTTPYSSTPHSVARSNPRSAQDSIPARGPRLHFAPFLQRNTMWNSMRQNKLEVLRLEKERAEQTMCQGTSLTHYKPRRRSMSQKAPVQSFAEKEDAEVAACTFQPSLNSSRRSYQRLRPTMARSRSAPSMSHPDAQHCVFTPMINRPKQSMVSCQAYLKNNVFDRLGWMKPQSKTSVPTNSGTSVPTNSGTSTSRGSSCGVDTLRSFLQRQNEHDVVRLERLSQTENKVYSDAHEPYINPRSRQIAERARMPHGYTCVGYDMRDQDARRADRRIRDLTWKLKGENSHDSGGNGFAPQINRRSAARSPRGVQSMHDDYARKLNDNAWRKARYEALEDEESPGRKFTFEPVLTSHGYSTPGRIKWRGCTSEYISHCEEDKARQQRRRTLAQELASKEASKECTFKPQLRKRPATSKASQDVVDARLLYQSLRGQTK